MIGEVTESGGKKKLSNIRAPMEGGKLMCEVELEDGLVRLDRLASGPEDGEVEREVVREVGSGSAPDGAGRAEGSRAGRGPNRAGRPEGSRPNRGRRDA